MRNEWELRYSLPAVKQNLCNQSVGVRRKTKTATRGRWVAVLATTTSGKLGAHQPLRGETFAVSEAPRLPRQFRKYSAPARSWRECWRVRVRWLALASTSLIRDQCSRRSK